MPILASSLLTWEGFQSAFKYWDMFVNGLLYTIGLSFLTVVFGFLLALIVAYFRMTKFKPLNWIASVYVEVLRATPLLVQLFIVYYVLFDGFKVSAELRAFFGNIPLERLIPGIVALSLNSAAYLSEIIRSGIQSIELGQTEAARSLGMSSWQNMRYIVLPQAIKNILPAIGNEFVTIIKESSICYTIGIQEIMYAANAVRGSTYRFGEALIIAACVYFCVTFPTSKIIAYFERRMSRGDRR